MKLVNCTDKKTDKLAQYGLVDQGIAVEGSLLMPGKEIDVKDADVARLEAVHEHLFKVGALAWVKPQAPEPKKEEPAPAPTDIPPSPRPSGNRNR